MKTVTYQRRTTRVGSVGGAEYLVETFVTDRGDLPDTGIFVIEVPDPLDPSHDTMARVATVPDMTEYGLDRAAALRFGVPYYRASVSTLTYTDINVAKTAVSVMADFVNRLSTAYKTFDDEFSTLGLAGAYPDHEQQDYPLWDDALEAQLVESIVQAREAVTVAEAALAEQRETCVALSTNITFLGERITLAEELVRLTQDLSSTCTGSVTSVSEYVSLASDFGNEVDTGIDAYMVDVDAGDITASAASYAFFNDPDRTTGSASDGTVAKKLNPFLDSVSRVNTDLRGLSRAAQLLGAKVTVLESHVTSLRDELVQAESSSTVCASEQRVAEVNVADAQAAETAAGEALLSVCPDYDLDTI